MRVYFTIVSVFLALLGCQGPPNNPYPDQDDAIKTLYSAFSERPKHLDPAVAYSANEFDIISHIYEPPLQYHYLDRPYRLTTLAAREFPEVRAFDEHGHVLEPASSFRAARSEITLRLRQDLRYQPHPAFSGLAAGTRVSTASDFAYQIKRLADPHLNSPIYGPMREHIRGFEALHQKIAAYREAHPGAWVDLRDFECEGLRVLDEQTLQLVLEGYYPPMLYWLAMPFFAPIPWEVDSYYHHMSKTQPNLHFDWYPVGTGPFYLVENNPNRRMLLLANPNYHEERFPETQNPELYADELLAYTGRRLPLIQRWVFSLETETIPRWMKFLQGYYDFSPISSDNFDQAVQVEIDQNLRVGGALEEQGIRLMESIPDSLVYWGFNWRDEVVGGNSERARLLRTAIALAVDVEEYISLFLNGQAVVAHGPLPPGLAGYDQQKPIRAVYDSSGQRRSLEQARALMKQAGYPHGQDMKTGQRLKITYDTASRGGPDDKAQYDWMRKQFDKIGIELEIRPTLYTRFLDKIANGQFQFVRWGWNADYHDPENFLFLFYGPNRADLGGVNATSYERASYDRLFEQMKRMPHGAERDAVVAQMLAMLQEDIPCLWGYYPKRLILAHGWTKNNIPHGMASNVIHYVDIDTEARARARHTWNQPVWLPLWVLVSCLLLLLVAWGCRLYAARRVRRS